LYASETYFWNVAAYCNYHHKYLTVKQIKQKHCLGKQCKHLVKNPMHNFWDYREKRKLLKKGLKNE